MLERKEGVGVLLYPAGRALAHTGGLGSCFGLQVGLEALSRLGGHLAH